MPIQLMIKNTYTKHVRTFDDEVCIGIAYMVMSQPVAPARPTHYKLDQTYMRTAAEVIKHSKCGVSNEEHMMNYGYSCA